MEGNEEMITLKKSDWQAAMNILDNLIKRNTQQQAEVEAHLAALREGGIVDMADVPMIMIEERK